LGVKKVEDLVYIYTNSKLLRERKGPNPITWYLNHPFSEDSDTDVASVHGEEDNDGDDSDGHDNDDNAHAHPDDVDNENADDWDLEFPMDNVGGHRSDEEPLNPRNEDRPQTPVDIGVFDWTNSDEEPLVGTRHVVEEVDDAEIMAYNRADDGIDDEEGVEVHHGNNDDNHTFGSHDENNTGGDNDVGVQIPNVEEVETRDEVNQPRDAVEQYSQERATVGVSNETLPRNVGSDSVETDLEEDVPIGEMFSKTLSIGTTLVGLGRA